LETSRANLRKWLVPIIESNAVHEIMRQEKRSVALGSLLAAAAITA